jgi:hypothetical protein
MYSGAIATITFMIKKEIPKEQKRMNKLFITYADIVHTSVDSTSLFIKSLTF